MVNSFKENGVRACKQDEDFAVHDSLRAFQSVLLNEDVDELSSFFEAVSREEVMKKGRNLSYVLDMIDDKSTTTSGSTNAHTSCFEHRMTSNTNSKYRICPELTHLNESACSDMIENRSAFSSVVSTSPGSVRETSSMQTQSSPASILRSFPGRAERLIKNGFAAVTGSLWSVCSEDAQCHRENDCTTSSGHFKANQQAEGPQKMIDQKSSKQECMHKYSNSKPISGQGSCNESDKNMPLSEMKINRTNLQKSDSNASCFARGDNIAKQLKNEQKQVTKNICRCPPRVLNSAGHNEDKLKSKCGNDMCMNTSHHLDVSGNISGATTPCVQAKSRRRARPSDKCNLSIAAARMAKFAGCDKKDNGFSCGSNKSCADHTPLRKRIRPNEKFPPTDAPITNGFVNYQKNNYRRSPHKTTAKVSSGLNNEKDLLRSKLAFKKAPKKTNLPANHLDNNDHQSPPQKANFVQQPKEIPAAKNEDRFTHDYQLQTYADSSCEAFSEQLMRGDDADDDATQVMPYPVAIPIEADHDDNKKCCAESSPKEVLPLTHSPKAMTPTAETENIDFEAAQLEKQRAEAEMRHKVLRPLPLFVPEFDLGLFLVRVAALSKHADDIVPLVEDDEIMWGSSAPNYAQKPVKGKLKADGFMLKKFVEDIPKHDGVFRKSADINDASWCGGFTDSANEGEKRQKMGMIEAVVLEQEKWNPLSIFGSSPPSVHLEDVFGYTAYRTTAPSARLSNPLFQRLSNFTHFENLLVSLSCQEWQRVASTFHRHWAKQCRLDLDWRNDPLTIDEIMWMLETNGQTEDKSECVYKSEVCFCVTPDPTVGFGWNDPRCHRYREPRPSMGHHILDVVGSPGAERVMVG